MTINKSIISVVAVISIASTLIGLTIGLLW
ncbi:TMhelix containing protein [Vibrio phage 1.225.O._10N.261.48.B7]|nr:TMhelix containing protein [Vibrio phage 1.225.O._10N.261.48.B7]